MKKKSLQLKLFYKTFIVCCVTTLPSLFFILLFFGTTSLFNFFNIIILTIFNSILSLIISRSLMTFYNDEIQNIESVIQGKKDYFYDESDYLEIFSLQQTLKVFKEKKRREQDDVMDRLKQYKRLFEGMPVGVLAVDGKFKVIRCNGRAFHLLDQRRPAGSIKGRPFEDLIFMEKFQDIVKTFINSDEVSVTEEFDFQSRLCITESIRATAIKLNKDEGGGALFIMENITTLRRLENMRSDFVSNVSHELKTPIAIIGGFVETLKECINEPETASHFLGIIGRNTKRLDMLIDDLLNLSRLEQDESRIKSGFQKKPLNDTIQSAVEICKREIESKNIQLELHLENQEYYRKKGFFANHRLIEQVMRNLIENAVRYSPEGTRVSIATYRRDKATEIVVRDSGPGIDKEHHEKVFERFYRIDKSRDRSTGGSGLGLSIVKHIIRLHQGTIRLDSQLGDGATFYISLPEVEEQLTGS